VLPKREAEQPNIVKISRDFNIVAIHPESLELSQYKEATGSTSFWPEQMLEASVQRSISAANTTTSFPPPPFSSPESDSYIKR
jgi:hypothetical protein